MWIEASHRTNLLRNDFCLIPVDPVDPVHHQLGASRMLAHSAGFIYFLDLFHYKYPGATCQSGNWQEGTMRLRQFSGRDCSPNDASGAPGKDRSHYQSNTAHTTYSATTI
jgi:hypothetical protein